MAPSLDFRHSFDVFCFSMRNLVHQLPCIFCPFILEMAQDDTLYRYLLCVGLRTLGFLFTFIVPQTWHESSAMWPAQPSFARLPGVAPVPSWGRWGTEELIVQWTAWCSEIGSLMDAPELHASSDVREPISLHQAVHYYGQSQWTPHPIKIWMLAQQIVRTNDKQWHTETSCCIFMELDVFRILNWGSYVKSVGIYQLQVSAIIELFRNIFAELINASRLSRSH